MRICIIGGGLAGTLLCWRLGAINDINSIDLVAGPTSGDATSVSGGGVRAYEPDLLARTNATESLAELLDSATLRDWSGYRQIGSTYLRPGWDNAAAEIAAIDALVPGDVWLSSRDELARRGWAELPEGTVAVSETAAGHIHPAGFRDAIMGELRGNPKVQISRSVAGRVVAGPGCFVDGQLRRYDIVVVAAGSRTPLLLADLDGGAGSQAASGLRIKAIQYGLYAASGPLPTFFVDESTGLYGRPIDAQTMLLGLPVANFGGPADGGEPDPDLARTAAEVARCRRPQMRLARPHALVRAADCYSPASTLTLQAVSGAPSVFTFTGGSGGSAKTVLAASRQAAAALIADPVAGRPQTGALINRAPDQPKNTLYERVEIMTADAYEAGLDTHAGGLPHYFAIGVGAGPSNLSLSALFKAKASETIALFDRKPSTGWHESLLHRGVRMQTSWLKDLVSVVDPTHELSFLNYLVTNGRLFALLNSQFDVIPRREYMRYLTWAAAQLENVNYGHNIDRVSYTDQGFVVYSNERPIARSKHLVLGVGTQPAALPGLSAVPSDRSFVADDLTSHLDDMRADTSAPIAVIGGGQTGNECVLKLLSEGFTDIRWYTRRTWFQTIDDSPIANDFYRPSHQEFLQALSRPTRRRLVEEMFPTGIALTPGALRTLYQANYDGMLELDRFPVTLLPGREITGGELRGDDVVLDCVSLERREEHRVKYAIVAIGRVNTPLPLDADLTERIDRDTDGEVLVGDDYSVSWKGMNGHRIYAMNRSMYANGIPDANLTLLPVRAAIVLNSMLGCEAYAIKDEFSPVQWG